MLRQLNKPSGWQLDDDILRSDSALGKPAVTFDAETDIWTLLIGSQAGEMEDRSLEALIFRNGPIDKQRV